MGDQPERIAGDGVLTRIGQVVMLQHAGDREEARNRFAELWTEVGEDGDALHRCTLAHYMADTQDDPAEELLWDLRALSAAQALSDGPSTDRDRSPEVRGFYPSLHLSLAADYVKLGRPETARTHLRSARAATAGLTDDGYGRGVRAAIERLQETLETAAEHDGPGPAADEGAIRPPRREA